MGDTLWALLWQLWPCILYLTGALISVVVTSSCLLDWGIVPSQSPSRHNLGRRHVGSEAYYGEHWNNSFVVCETSEDHKCSRRFWIVDDFFSFRAVMDHCSFPLLGGVESFCVWPDFCPAHVTV